MQTLFIFMKSERKFDQIDTLVLNGILFLVLNISIESAKLSFSTNVSKGGI